MNSEWEDNPKEAEKLKQNNSSVFYDPVNDIYRTLDVKESPNPNYEKEKPSQDEVGSLLQKESLTSQDGGFDEKIAMPEDEEKPWFLKRFWQQFKGIFKGTEKKNINIEDTDEDKGGITLTLKKLREYQSLSVLVFGSVMILSAFFGSSASVAAGLMMAGLLIMSLPVFIKAFKGIISGVVNQFCYISIGVIISIISAAFAMNSMAVILLMAVAVVIFVLSQKWMNKSFKKKQSRVDELLELPSQNIKVIDSEGNWTEVPQETIKTEQNISVTLGQHFPVDCTILMGKGEINQKAINGNDCCETVSPGDTVLAGTICGAQEFVCKVISDFDDSFLSKRNKIIKDAAKVTGNYQENIMRILKYFSAAFCVMVLPVIILPSLFDPQNISKWLGQGISILVVASPAAFFASIFLSYRCGIVKAANSGIVIKGYRYLELLANAKSFVFAKNGVISTGIPKVKEIFYAKGTGKEDTAKFLTAVEGSSEHPIAKAILKYSGKVEVPPVTNVSVIDGKGVCADCGDDKIICGSIRFVNEMGIDTTPMPYAGTILAVNNEVVCGFSLVDDVNDDAESIIKELKSMGINDISMITGDCERSTFLCAEAVGLKNYKYELIPDEKVSYVANKKIENGPCVFIGDHETDNSVLAVADTGISMGFSKENTKGCPVLILNKNISSVATAVSICKKTLAAIKKNIVMFCIFKLLIVILALFGVGNIIFSIISDVVFSVFCTTLAYSQLKNEKVQ